jgi:hypothetical protein
MIALADEDEDPSDDLIMPNRFSGNVTLNGAPASVGTVINAYIDGGLRGSVVVESPGEYEHLSVKGSASDDGENITFTVCGANSEQNGTWSGTSYLLQILDLTAEEDEAPEVTDATATPPSIVADGVETTRLTVNVTDGCTDVADVTVNLSAIGGSDAQVMDFNGGNMYSTTVTAASGTAQGTYYLYVNASDVFGNYDDTSVCIELTIYVKGDFNGNGVIDIGDVAKIANLQLGNIPTTPEDLVIGDFNGNGVIDIGDVAKLANYQLDNIDEL